VAELEEPRRREGSKRDRRWWVRETASRGYLQGHTDPQLKQLNAAILRNLPALEKRVRDGKPPAYCAAPGIGLDDRKFAKVPKRPPSLRLPKPSG
jgi:hypothetical protein